MQIIYKYFLFIYLFFLPSFAIYGMEITKKTVISCILGYGTAIATNIFHELGHCIAIKLLFNKSCSIQVSLNPFNGAITFQKHLHWE